MRDIASIAKMELRFILKQGMTSYLILVYPILAMLIISPAFSSVGFEKVNIAMLASETEMMGLMNQSPEVNIIPVPDHATLLETVIKGKALLGIERIREKDRYSIMVLQDPLKSAIATEITLVLEKQISDQKAALLGSKVTEVWNNMVLIAKDVDERIAKVPEFRASAGEHRERIQSVMEARNNFNVTELKQLISESNADLDNTTQTLVSLYNDLLVINDSMNDFDSSLDAMDNYEMKVMEFRSRVVTISSEAVEIQRLIAIKSVTIDEKIVELNNTYQFMEDLKNGADPDTVSLINQAQAEVWNYMIELVNMKTVLADAGTIIEEMDVEEFDTDVNKIISDLDDIRVHMKEVKNDTSRTLASVNSNVTDAFSKMENNRKRLAQMESQVNDAAEVLNVTDEFIAKFEEDLKKLNEEVEKTQEIMLDARRNIRKFLENKPIELVPPSVYKQDAVPGIKTLNLLYPAVLGIDALLSCLMMPLMMGVRQRRQGAEMRIRMTGVKKWKVVLGRFLANWIIGVFIMVIIALTGVFMSGISLGKDLGAFALAIALGPAVFSAAGVALSTFINRESTALLVSLLISIPMIFLSGVVLPLEFVRGPMRLVGESLPLTYVINAIAGVMIRGMNVGEISGSAWAVAAYTAASLFAAYAIMRLRKHT